MRRFPLDRIFAGMSRWKPPTRHARSALAAGVIVLLAGHAGAGVTPPNADFTCSGKRTTSGTAFGQHTNRVKFVLNVRAGRPTTIVDTTGTAICPPRATCAYAVSGDQLQVRVDHVPQADPHYTARFGIDTGTGRYAYDGGGLDGAWSETGKCKAAKSSASVR